MGLESIDSEDHFVDLKADLTQEFSISYIRFDTLHYHVIFHIPMGLRVQIMKNQYGVFAIWLENDSAIGEA